MAIINYSKNFIICALVLTIASCSKYERTNPNDILGPDGTPVLAIDGYEVISDNNSDAKIQKNETATLKVLVKNTGTKLSQITSAIFTSNSSKIVIENFSPDNIMMGYVGKKNPIGNLRIKVASNATAGETLTCNAKLTDKAGKEFNITLTLTVSDLKPSVISISNSKFVGLNEADAFIGTYSKGLTPIVEMVMTTIGNTDYSDDLKVTITSLNATYPYQFSKTISADIQAGTPKNFEVWLDCLPQSIPNNTNLPLNIAVTDNQGGTIEKQINVIVRPNSAKLDFNSYYIWRGTVTPGSIVSIDCEVKNSGGRALVFLQSGAKISTTSPYLNNLSISINNGTIDQNETSSTLFGFSAEIDYDCPLGIKIPITIELTTNETCPTKFTSIVELDIQ